MKAIFRNVIANAVNYTSVFNKIVLKAFILDDAKTQCSISNPCCIKNYNKVKDIFEQISVDSKSKGYGLILIKEFVQKITENININYTDNQIVFFISF